MKEFLKSLHFSLVCLAVFICLICISCSKSSSGKHVTTEELVKTLDSYNFSIQIFDNADKDHAPLAAELAIDSKPASVSIDTSEPITGTYDVKKKEYSLNGLPNQFKITIDTGAKTPTQFTVQLIDSIVSTGTALPATGKFRMFFGGDIITVTISDAPIGVTLSYGGEEDTLDWKELDALLRTPAAPLWQQQAALATTLMGLLMDQINLVVFTKECMNKYKLSDGNAISIVSDTFPPGSMSSTSDNLWLKWVDVSGDSKLDAGDSFTWIFNNSWEYDPLTGVGNLYSAGKVDLRGYSQDIVSIEGKDTLMSFGFNKDTSSNKAGVYYDDLDIAKTLNVSNLFGTSLRLTGGFWIKFQGD